MRYSKLAASMIVGLSLIGFSSAFAASSKSFKGAITAKELLVLMGACNLKSVPGHSREMRANFQQMCTQGITLLKLGATFDKSPRWLWQPGAMRDHPDFTYAGNREIGPALAVIPVDGISLDSSHFYAKWPLFFLAGRDAAPPEDAAFFSKALDGIVEGLFSRVVDGKPSTGECVIRYRTYTDGTNGVFRWNWQNKGATYGNGAYQQSISPFHSSMALLDDERIARHYKEIYSCYPYSRGVRNTYFNTRDLDPYKLLISLSETRPSLVGTSVTIPTEEQVFLYKKYLRGRLLGNNVTVAADAYDAVVGTRMLVMHYAFIADYKLWIDDFFVYADHASSLLCNTCDRFESLYYELHLVFFLTRFLEMASENGYAGHSAFGRIRDRVDSRLNDLYFNPQRDQTSNYGWDGVRFYTFKEYVEWKLRYYGVSSDGTSRLAPNPSAPSDLMIVDRP